MKIQIKKVPFNTVEQEGIEPRKGSSVIVLNNGDLSKSAYDFAA